MKIVITRVCAFVAPLCIAFCCSAMEDTFKLPTQEEKKAIFAALGNEGEYDPVLLENGKASRNCIEQLERASQGIAAFAQTNDDAANFSMAMNNFTTLTFNSSKNIGAIDFKEYYEYFLKKNNISDSDCKDREKIKEMYNSYGNFTTYFRDFARFFQLKDWISAEGNPERFIEIYNAKIVLDVLKKIRAQNSKVIFVSNSNSKY